MTSHVNHFTQVKKVLAGHNALANFFITLTVACLAIAWIHVGQFVTARINACVAAWTLEIFIGWWVAKNVSTPLVWVGVMVVLIATTYLGALS